MKKDLAALQGTWQITSLEVDGEVMPSGAFSEARVVVSDHRFASLGMGNEYEGAFELDPSKKPKAFDLVFTSGPAAGTRNRGIYRIEHGGWTLCLATRGDKRPRTFATKADSGIALETFARVDAASASPKKRAHTVTAQRPTPSAAAAAVGTPTVIEGQWQMVSAVMNGLPMPPNMVEWCRRETRGDVTTVLAGTNLMLRARFALDKGQRPWAIDYENIAGENNGKGQLGIAELSGDTLRICMSPPGAPRPADFESVKGDKRSYTTWIRIT
jgi:uncharacterized protein (TIGR03067 family)